MQKNQNNLAEIEHYNNKHEFFRQRRQVHTHRCLVDLNKTATTISTDRGRRGEIKNRQKRRDREAEKSAKISGNNSRLETERPEREEGEEGEIQELMIQSAT
eukprot:6188323-Pleurochrysis_carterae.AAC.1